MRTNQPLPPERIVESTIESHNDWDCMLVCNMTHNTVRRCSNCHAKMCPRRLKCPSCKCVFKK